MPRDQNKEAMIYLMMMVMNLALMIIFNEWSSFMSFISLLRAAMKIHPTIRITYHLQYHFFIYCKS